ncbi:Flp family type IVb pilin [Inquilinus sp.]|jgi:pilus assembly protein Flp/PilA|uniref:Flp family type IVb pilin n=1 Tax=Inquilinus sp. TaxID=1932117 RepID=UPI0037846753
MLRKLINAGRRAVREDDGITAVEYAILAALVAGGLVLAVPTLNTAISAAFTKIGGIISPAP